LQLSGKALAYHKQDSGLQAQNWGKEKDSKMRRGGGGREREEREGRWQKREERDEKEKGRR
jgi:hypothetical protein